MELHQDMDFALDIARISLRRTRHSEGAVFDYRSANWIAPSLSTPIRMYAAWAPLGHRRRL